MKAELKALAKAIRHEAQWLEESGDRAQPDMKRYWDARSQELHDTTMQILNTLANDRDVTGFDGDEFLTACNFI